LDPGFSPSKLATWWFQHCSMSTAQSWLASFFKAKAPSAVISILFSKFISIYFGILFFYALCFFWQGLQNEEFSPSQLSKMFGSHATMMANTLRTPIIVFTQTGSMAVLLSHYRPSSTLFAFTNE
jgi:hypothetical protein